MNTPPNFEPNQQTEGMMPVIDCEFPEEICRAATLLANYFAKEAGGHWEFMQIADRGLVCSLQEQLKVCRTPPPVPEDGATPETDARSFCQIDGVPLNQSVVTSGFARQLELCLRLSTRENAGLKEKLAEAKAWIAGSVSLKEGLGKQNQELQSTVASLRAALEKIVQPEHPMGSNAEYARHAELAAKEALSSRPAPAMVPVEDVKP